MANLFQKVRGFFSSSDIHYEKDKEILENLETEDVIKKGSANPNPVFAKAIHAGLVYNPSLSDKNEVMYTPPEYNLGAVANALDTDSYFRRAVEKYIELMWKAGYSFYGKNPNAVKYIRKRFEQIAMVTSIPTDILLRDASYQLVEFSNCYISKVRKKDASGGKYRTTFSGQTLAPVAGYFIEDSVSMRLAVNENGDPLGYKQQIPGSAKYKIWKPWNIIHMMHSRKPGLRVGTPMCWSVLDDIRALRRIEQNVELLVFQHTIPLFQYIVGTPERPAQTDEITSVKATVEKMPPNGCLVTPERHKIVAVGMDKANIDASIYLEYFKSRVLSGLGMSGVGMGDGGTSNKGTAIVLDKHLTNTTNTFQQIFASYVNEFMIKELLAEGGFDTSYVEEDNKVILYFPPIDTEEQRAKENHYSQMYAQHILTEDETRRELGREPIQDSERDNMYIDIVTKPMAILEAKLKQESGADKQGKAKAQPSNQYGKLQTKPRFPKNDEIDSIIGIINDTKNDIIDACIDSFEKNEDMTLKFSSLRKYSLDNSKKILTEKMELSTLDNKKAVYNTALNILDEGFKKFEALKDMKHLDDITIKTDSLFNILSKRLEVLIDNKYNISTNEDINE